jgi:8-oxo-dGTP pyrophosphatase MutT (NUDIX family)
LFACNPRFASEKNGVSEISAGLVIYNASRDGAKFLLLYHWNGYWNFPKGKLEEGERSFRAALREVKEETGINQKDLRFREYFKVSDTYVFMSEGRRVHKRVDFYLAEAQTTRVRISDEHDGYGWFLYKDAVPLLKHKNLRETLKKAYDTITQHRRPARHPRSPRRPHHPSR